LHLNGDSKTDLARAGTRAQVDFDDNVTKADSIVEAVEDCGFEASLLAVQGSRQKGQKVCIYKLRLILRRARAMAYG